MDNGRVLDISWGTILKVSFTLLCFYIVYLIRDILIWIVFAMIISILFNPAIDFFQKKIHFPRVLSTILVYVAFFGIIGFTTYWSAPIFFHEIQQFAQSFPQYFEKISPPLRIIGIQAFDNLGSFTQTIEITLQKAPSNVFSAIGIIFGGILSTVSIFSLAIFLSLEEKGIDKVVMILSPRRHESYFLSLWNRSQRKVAGWFGARLLACMFVGTLTAISCYVLDIKYAMAFGLIAGVLDIIPAIGPVIAGTMIILFVILMSWFKALLMLIIFILIQQAEGNILIPLLTKKFIGLPPIIVLIALLVGGKLWGILGTVLAIPLAGMLFEFLKDFLEKRKISDSKNEFSINRHRDTPRTSKKIVIL